MLMSKIGAPGWNVFVQPLLEHINPSLKLDLKKGADDDVEIVDLSRDRVLVTPQSLKQSLHRLKVLILSNPSPGLCKRVLRPVILQTWALASWVDPSQSTEEAFCKPARSLVQTYLTLFGNVDSIMPLIQDLLCKGSSSTVELQWMYHLTAEGGVEVVLQRDSGKAMGIDLDWNEVDSKATNMVDFIVAGCSIEEVSSVFLNLLRRWIQTTQPQGDIKIEISSDDRDLESPVQDLVKVTILQKLMEKAPDKLVSHFDQLLDLVCQVFKADGRSPLGEDVIAVVLSLLNLVITAPSFRKSDISADDLKVIEESLERLGQQDSDSTTTARNLGMLLKYREELESSDDPISAPSTRQIEDRKTYKLAMEYITGGADNPPPVVSEGLNLLSSLVLSESPILDVTAVTVLMSNLLKDNEDYINLRVIKVFTQLANKHPRSTVSELLDHYLDSQEKLTTDVRLRFGEALLQVMERLGDTFTGEVAQLVSETLLSIAGRRGYRPKTMAKQLRDEKLRKMKKDKDGEEDEEMLELEETTEEEKAKNDVLAQILQGWESKRGSEDIRMRTSSLSIFGSAIETNISGVGPTRISAGVDLCLNVLAMEPEMEKGILRRAAILVILGFVRGLDSAREAGRKLGFGLTSESREDIVRTLEYIAGTDNDGLVRQHAGDVVESLENWQMAGLLPQQNETAAPPGLTRLAGLHVNPEGTLVDGSGRARPRIEEVE